MLKRSSLLFITLAAAQVSLAQKQTSHDGQVWIGYNSQTRISKKWGIWLDGNQLQVGYLNVFQQLAAGNRYRNSHVIRVFFFHNPDLRKRS